MRYDDERFVDLDTGRRGRRPGRRWTGSVGQRSRAAQGFPPAVFKISSYSHSARAVRGRFQYISRDGEVEAEGPDGMLRGREELDGLADFWEGMTEEGRGRRQAMSAMVSFPAGVDEEQAKEAARQFFREAFADTHDYVFAGHQDTKNFHVHVVVQATGQDGKKIRIQRADIQDLRMLFAEKAAEQGIELDASPRWARGEERGKTPSPEVEGIMRRWARPELELAGAFMPSPIRRTQLEALAAVRRDRDPEGDVTPLEYARAAERVMGAGGETETTTEKVARVKAAVQLARFGLHQAAAARGRGDENAAEAWAAWEVVGGVDKAVSAEIRGLGDDPAGKRAALSARRPLADQLAEERPPAERRWARGEEAERAAGRGAAVQGLEYARAAGKVAVGLHTLPTDHDRVAGVKAAVSLARFGWELAARDKAPTPEGALAREIIDTTERTVRDEIQHIKDPQAKREAIQARAVLYHAGVKEYRAERQAEEQQRRREREREEGWER